MRPDSDLYARVSQFYAHEAALLDRRLLYEWVDLFADEATYKVHALHKHQESRGRAPVLTNRPVVLFEDDKDFLAKRAERILDTGFAHAERPPSTTRHLFTNVLLDETDGGELQATSSFVAFQARLERDRTTFYGTRHDLLREEPDTFRVLGREVYLDQFVLDRSVTILF